MLFDQLIFRDRKPVAQEKVLQGVRMQNIENVQGGFTLQLEIEAKVIGAKAIEGVAGADEATEWFTRMRQQLGFERGDGLDGGQLGERVEFFKLTQGLRGERNLKHKGVAWAVSPDPASPAWRAGNAHGGGVWKRRRGAFALRHGW